MASFDPETALTAAGLDPRRATVVELTSRDDYAAALIDGTGDGTAPRLELFRQSAGRGWVNAASGDGEAVSDGRAIAAWDAGAHRIVLGYLTPDEAAAPAAAVTSGPTRDRSVTLIWLTLLTAAIWPGATGAYVWEGATSVSLFFVVQMLIAAVTGFLILRSVVRLWRDPRAEATKGFALALTLVALLLLVIAYPQLTDDRLASKPVGVVALLVGGNLVALAVRELWQWRARRPAPSV